MSAPLRGLSFSGVLWRKYSKLVFLKLLLTLPAVPHGMCSNKFLPFWFVINLGFFVESCNELLWFNFHWVSLNKKFLFTGDGCFSFSFNAISYDIFCFQLSYELPTFSLIIHNFQIFLHYYSLYYFYQ